MNNYEKLRKLVEPALIAIHLFPLYCWNCNKCQHMEKRDQCEREVLHWLHQEENVETNREWITKLSDKEFASWLRGLMDADDMGACNICPAKDPKYCTGYKKCVDALVDWLNAKSIDDD